MKRRICCFCETWESGGIESFLNNVLLHMDLSNIEVDIVATQIRKSVFTLQLKEHGIKFWELSGHKTNIIKNYQLFDKLLKNRQYDLVHLNVFQGMSLYYARLSKKAGVSVCIAHSHNTDLRQSRTRFIKLWLHKLYSNLYAKESTLFWACSSRAAEFMFPKNILAERKFTFIPNGIDTTRFRFNPISRESVRQALDLADRVVIGNVGRLCYQKNQLFLLDILLEALKIRSNSCLLLVGDGEDRAALEEKAHTLNIADRVIFYGTTNQVEKLFWAMDVFAFPSRFEGLGIVAVEAQAAGIPAVCSENIPEEAAVTPLFYRQPLAAGSMAWAELLCKQSDSNKGYARLVAENGFDIFDVAKYIEESYLGK